MKRITTILATALTVLSVASCGFDPAKDTGKFLDKAIAAVNDGDKAKAGEKLNDFASKLDGIDAADAKAFFEAYWSYRENYSDGSYGSHIEFDNVLEDVLFASDADAAAAFLGELLNGAYETQDETAFSNISILYERQCYNGDHDRQLKMREKREAWFESLRAREEAKRAEPAPEPEAEPEVAMSGFSASQYAIDIMEAFYRAAAAEDLEAYCEVDFECGEPAALTEAQWEEYAKAEADWKKANPEKWAVIRAYRQALIADGMALTITSLD